MAIKLSKVAKDRGIEYFLISFVDLFGSLRSKLVPARAIDDMQKDGAGFAGFAAWLDMTPAHPDMFAIPDPDSLIQLPWKPEVAWLASDLWMDGKPVEASCNFSLSSRIVLLFRSIVAILIPLPTVNLGWFRLPDSCVFSPR
jgi:glutamine synthetase